MPNITKLKLQDDILYTLSAPILLDQEESDSTTSAPSSAYIKSKIDDINSDIYDLQQQDTTLQNNINGKLSLSGGTLNGVLYTPKSTFVVSADSNGGTTGWHKMINIKIISNYTNCPIFFIISQRGVSPFGILSITFLNANNLDPTIQNFYKTGNIMDVSAVHAGTSTWDIYIKKSEAYDNIGIVYWGTNFNYMNSHVQVTFPCTFHTSIPSGGVAPTTTSLWGA